MRPFAIALCGILLAGCGSSSSPPPPKPTPAPTQGYTDRASHVAVHVDKVRKTATHALLLVTMRNSGGAPYEPAGPAPFLDSALTDPTSKGINGPCDADSSVGDSLDYSSVPAHATHSGWIRCDYPQGSRVVAVIWEDHQIDAFRISS